MKTLQFSSILSIAVAFSLGILSSVVADDAIVSGKDKSFIKNAYENSLAEVAAGQMGQSKSAHPDVKAFAAAMVTDHSKAGAELKALADAKKVSVATEPTVVAKAKGKMLDTKSGAEFDKAFAESMVADHKKVIAAFEEAAKEAKDADVKAFIDRTLPTLRTHLSHAEALQQKVGK